MRQEIVCRNERKTLDNHAVRTIVSVFGLVGLYSFCTGGAYIPQGLAYYVSNDNAKNLCQRGLGMRLRRD